MRHKPEPPRSEIRRFIKKTVREQLDDPRESVDSTNVLSNKWHWYTKPDTREKLWQTARKWIKAGSWIIRSKNFLAEMESFQKDEDDSKRAEHGAGDHDDELFCFESGTRVVTRGFSLVPIEKIKPGDKVLTISGSFEKVLGVSCRLYSAWLPHNPYKLLGVYILFLIALAALLIVAISIFVK